MMRAVSDSGWRRCESRKPAPNLCAAAGGQVPRAESLLCPRTSYPVTSFPGQVSGFLFCRLALKCQDLPGGGFLPALAVALPRGPILAAGVVGS